MSDLKKLKESWLKDPIWDIEETEGFEDYYDELLSFRLSKEKEWDRHYKETQIKKNSDNFVKFSYDFINSTSDSSEFIMSKVYYELLEKIQALEKRISDLENGEC